MPRASVITATVVKPGFFANPRSAYRISEKYNDLIRRKGIDVYAWAAETGRQIVDVG